MRQKSISVLPSLSDIKSIRSLGTWSIPKVQRSSYLELYMLRREKERLEKELFMLDKRRNSANRQLDNIIERIEKLQRQTREKEGMKIYRKVPTAPLKTLAIRY